MLAAWNNHLEFFNFLTANTNNILDQNEDRLSTYKEGMRFQQEINNSNYFNYSFQKNNFY